MSLIMWISISVLVLYALGETVTEGTINVTLNWSVKPGQTIPIVKDTLDFCDLMVPAHCQLETTRTTTVVTFPKNIPRPVK